MDFTTRLLLFALSATAGLAVGMFFAKSLKEKRDFYEELLGFANAVSADMTFRQDGIRAVSSIYANNCKSKLKHFLEEFCETPSSIPEIKFLKAGENVSVTDFFSRLGKSDLVTQQAEIERSKSIIAERRDFYKNKFSTMYPMAIKPGLLCGIALGIIML